MSITLPWLRPAKHDPDTIIRRLRDDVATANVQYTDTLISSCQDAAHIARLETELTAAVGEVKRLQQKTIRDAANLERLRQAVINARPRITYTVQNLDRPYIARIENPYRVPVQQQEVAS